MAKIGFLKWLYNGIRDIDWKFVGFAILTVLWVIGCIILLLVSIPFAFEYHPLWLLGFPIGLIGFLYFCYWMDETR